MNDGDRTCGVTQRLNATVAGRGHRVSGPHFGGAPAQPIAETTDSVKHQGRCVSAGDEVGQFCAEPQFPCALLIAELREVHRMRQDLVRSETALTNRIKAIGRRMNGGQKQVESQLGDAPAGNNGGQVHGETQHYPALIADFAALPLIEARAIVHKARLKPELRMKHIVRQLPIYPWMKGIKNFGEIGLAQLIGEAGDLTRFATVSKLWKWMGVAVMPDGKRQRKVAGAAALEHKYNPQRRAILSVIGDVLMRADNQYRDFYLREKERQRGKMPDASDGHIHNRALRHMEKRLLCDLWVEWRRLHGPTGS